jgi:phosphatidylglycerophosphatase A
MNYRPSAAPATGRKTPWAWTVATFFGVGLLKPGPGTWASVVAMLLWMAVESPSFGIWSKNLSDHTIFIVFGVLLFALKFLPVAIATVIGIPAATRVAQESGREDPGHVVIDEVAGQWLTLTVCRPDWQHALLGLALFRLFDITKPWPIRKLEALPGGWGIMLDDLAAGLFALIVLLVIQHWW